jgi:hypothetical protein
MLRENFASDDTGSGSVGRTSRWAVMKFRYGSTRSSSLRIGTVTISANAATTVADTMRVRPII